MYLFPKKMFCESSETTEYISLKYNWLIFTKHPWRIYSQHYRCPGRFLVSVTLHCFSYFFAILKEELRKKDRKEERINETNRK